MLTVCCPQCGRSYQCDPQRIGLSLLCQTPGCRAIVPVQAPGFVQINAKPSRSVRHSGKFSWKLFVGVGVAIGFAWLLTHPHPELAPHLAPYASPAPAVAASPPPATGTSLFTVDGKTGAGELTIINGTDQDAVIKLAAEEATLSAYRSVYVRKGDQWTVEGIAAGRYRILFAQGDGWNKSERTFAENVSVQEFEQPLTFEDDQAVTQATITLQKVAEGNARTTDYDPSGFDALR